MHHLLPISWFISNLMMLILERGERLTFNQHFYFKKEWTCLNNHINKNWIKRLKLIGFVLVVNLFLMSPVVGLVTKANSFDKLLCSLVMMLHVRSEIEFLYSLPNRGTLLLQKYLSDLTGNATVWKWGVFSNKQLHFQ